MTLATSSGRLRILVVEDEALIRWALRQALAGRGHDVVEAADGFHALEAIQAGPQFDVVLLDFRLPDRHDSSLLEDVRRHAPDAAVFMMTAYSDETMRAQAHALGARAIIDKPFHIDPLIAFIESIHA